MLLTSPWTKHILHLVWLAVSVSYLFKFASKNFDSLTSYGRLRASPATQNILVKLLSLPVTQNGTGFTVFYVVGVVETAMCIYILNGSDLGANKQARERQVFVLGLFLIHVLKRAVECLFVHKFSRCPMNLVNFLFGLSFYVCVPLGLAVDGDAVFVVPATTPLYALTVTCFFLAIITQFVSHQCLASLREGGVAGVAVYRIPRAWPFALVSSPHYAAEIALYAAITLLMPTQTTILQLVFVILNLSHRAHNTHQWYHTTFPRSYPANRTRLIPFVW
eukprot:c2098_g1_i1.p1 GENE.c2098_g1_i1~~c2098_g1_i1.p1  ORF type:complete len:277 (-),score=87.97 c2098_g1_i1:129-959(-)